jgi:hypothetical protein
MPASWNQIAGWLIQIDALREAGPIASAVS